VTALVFAALTFAALATATQFWRAEDIERLAHSHEDLPPKLRTWSKPTVSRSIAFHKKPFIAAKKKACREVRQADASIAVR
jgi:hypothetical protein